MYLDNQHLHECISTCPSSHSGHRRSGVDKIGGGRVGEGRCHDVVSFRIAVQMANEAVQRRVSYAAEQYANRQPFVADVRLSGAGSLQYPNWVYWPPTVSLTGMSFTGLPVMEYIGALPKLPEI